MNLLYQANTPLGVALLNQYFYGDRYPFPYQLPYKFVYRKKILLVEPVQMKYSLLKFVQPLISFFMVVICAVAICCLNIEVDIILDDKLFWIWNVLILMGLCSVYVYILDAIYPDKFILAWKQTVGFSWHMAKGT